MADPTPPIGRPEDSIDLPFEPFPPGQSIELDADFEPTGAVVVLAASVPVPEIGTKPCLIFRFTRPDGTFYPPKVLICDEPQLLDLKSLIYRAVNAAVRAAREANAETP